MAGLEECEECILYQLGLKPYKPRQPRHEGNGILSMDQETKLREVSLAEPLL